MTVPVLVCPQGVLGDSTAILEYADHADARPGRLYPADPSSADEVRALEDHFDDVLGPHGRRWMYHNMLDQKDLIRDYGTTGVPDWERRMLPVLRAAATPMIRRVLDVTDETAARSLVRVQEVFDEVAKRLSDGRPFLVGDGFTAADLTFAALSAAVIVPERYGIPLPQPDLLPEPMASRVLEFRRHPAGEFALRIYAEERSATAALSPAT